MKKQKIKKPIIDWIQFDSDLEQIIYNHIKEGIIHNIVPELKWAKIISPRPQSYEILPAMKLWGKTFRALKYTPDFIIKIWRKEIVLEVKSKWTASKPDYRLRIKIFLSLYGSKLNFAELIQHNSKKYEYIKYYD